MKTILAICAVATIALFLAAEARGHDDAAWIQDGGYTNEEGVHCCGPSDCRQIRILVAMPAQHGDSSTLMRFGIEVNGHRKALYSEVVRIMPSSDEHDWLCKHSDTVWTDDTLKARCMFLAPRM